MNLVSSIHSTKVNELSEVCFVRVMADLSMRMWMAVLILSKKHFPTLLPREYRA